MNKRVVIGIAAAVVGLVLVSVLGVLLADDDRQLGALNRSYATGKFALEIGGVKTGFVKSVSGCEIRADVVRAQPGTDNVVRKHVAGPVYEPCVVEVGASMDKPVYDWIASLLARAPTRKDVTIIETDYSYKEKARTTLTNALLTKVRFPALDGASKDTAWIQLTITPEMLTKKAGSGAPTYGTISGKQKAWLASNFRFSLNGVNDLDKVGKISALEVTQQVTQSSVGELRDYEKEPGKTEVGDLTVSIAASHSASLDAWFDDFVVKGNNAQASEKSGTLEFLSPNLQDVLFSLSLQGVGIFRAADTPKDTNAEQLARKLYSLYVEEVSFTAPTAAVPVTNTNTTSTATTTTTTPTTTTTKAAPIEATITPVAGELLTDGESFTISDGVNEPTTFEFDLDGVVKGVPIKFSKEAPPEEVASAIVEAINSVGEQLGILAKQPDAALIQLQSERGDEAGEEKILEFVESEEFEVRDAVPAKEEEGLPAPTELTATTGAGEGEIDLRWQPSEGALGYIVAFRTEPEAEYIDLDKTEGTELTLAGLKSGVTHYFVVRALDGTNESKNSNEASAAAG